MERLLRVGDFLSAVLVTCFIIWMELFFYYSYCLTHYTEVPVPSGHFFVMTDFIFMLIVHHSYELLEPSIPRWVFLQTLRFLFYWCYYKFGFYPVVFFCQQGLFYFLYRQNPTSKKLSAYACGFELYENSRHIFDVRFFIAAILFVIFDTMACFNFKIKFIRFLIYD